MRHPTHRQGWFLGNTAQIDQARVKQGNKTATAATGQRSGADELEKRAMLRKDGVLTEEEFSAAKGRVLSGEETSDGAPAKLGGGAVVKEAHTRSRHDGNRTRLLPSNYDAVRQLVAVTGSSRIFE